jgi:hypothetical protein
MQVLRVVGLQADLNSGPPVYEAGVSNEVHALVHILNCVVTPRYIEVGSLLCVCVCVDGWMDSAAVFIIH